MVSCSYEFDSHTWQRDHDVNIEDHWTWSCPYEVVGEKERCIFHMDPIDRQAASLSEEDLTKAFVENVLRGDFARLHGASLDNLELDFLNLNNQTDTPVNLLANSFGDLSLENAQISVTLRLAYSDFDNLNLKHVVITRPLDIQRATINNTLDGTMATLERVYSGGAYIEECLLPDSKIDRIGLSEATIGILNLRYSELSIILNDVEVIDEIAIYRTKFKKIVQCQNATYHCPFEIEQSTIEGRLLLEETEFHSDVKIRDSDLEGAGLAWADVEGRLDLSGVTMDEIVLDEATFHEKVHIRGTFQNRIRMNNPTTNDNVELYGITSEKVYLNEVDTDEFSISSEKISDLTIFNSNISYIYLSGSYYDTIKIDGVKVPHLSINNTHISSIFQMTKDNSNFSKGNVWGKVQFFKTNIESIIWKGNPISQASHIQFIRGEIKEADLYQPDNGVFVYSFVQTKLSHIISYNSDGNNLRHLHFLRPEFDGFPFEEYTDELAPNWELNRGPGIGVRSFTQSPSERYQTYQSARADAENLNQEDARSGLYKQEMKQRIEFLNARSRMNKERWSKFKAFEIKLLNWICGYGEEPWKPLVWAGVGILTFALVYSAILFGQENTLTTSLVSGFTLSLQSFATLVFGVENKSISTTLRFLTSIEGALSTLLIPFLVFSLTKSID